MNKIIFSLLIIVFLLKTGNVFSNINIFHVDNIVVDTKGNLNKEQLLNNAFRKGFDKLVKKILLKKDQDLVLSTSNDDIKKMISNYQIYSNDNFNKNEFKINLSFDRQRMNNFFSLKGISYADLSKTSLLLFPVLVEKDNFYLFSNNYFYKNWNIKNDEKEKENEFVEYIMPIENLEYVQIIQQNKNSLETIDLNKLLSDYNVKNYVFLVIRPLKEKTNIFLKANISENNIVKNFQVINSLDVDRISNFGKIRENIKREIVEILKSQNLIDIRTPSFLNIFVDIKKQDDLLKTRSILKKIKLIENFYVLELNKNYAKVKIKYFGKLEKIKSKFDEMGIELKNSDNQWKVVIR